jgi:uncharacterized FAD-dependent dehydrogenase
MDMTCIRLFAGLVMAEMGYKPIIMERGADVDTRAETVRKFWEQGKLDPECNVQFGEGGAGTFSDGTQLSSSTPISSRCTSGCRPQRASSVAASTW